VVHGVRCLSIALRITSSLRMQAVSATLRFTVTEQPLIEGTERRIIAAAHQRSHIEHIPYVCAAAPNHALAATRATVAVKRAPLRPGWQSVDD
jgi:hypothetical protein